jgi:hypothetical protein
MMAIENFARHVAAAPPQKRDEIAALQDRLSNLRIERHGVYGQFQGSRPIKAEV